MPVGGSFHTSPAGGLVCRLFDRCWEFEKKRTLLTLPRYIKTAKCCCFLLAHAYTLALILCSTAILGQLLPYNAHTQLGYMVALSSPAQPVLQRNTQMWGLRKVANKKKII
jgi:hypothetical protein